MIQQPLEQTITDDDNELDDKELDDHQREIMEEYLIHILETGKLRPSANCTTRCWRNTFSQIEKRENNSGGTKSKMNTWRFIVLETFDQIHLCACS